MSISRIAGPETLLSTMYLQHRPLTLDGFASLARDLGFAGIEASHIITREHLDGLHQEWAFPRTVHAPAPRAATRGSRDAMRLISSPDAGERRWAVEQVQASIDWASEVGASVVCVHLGTVEGVADEEWVLEQRFLAGQRHTSAYERQRRKVEQHRDELAPSFFQAARRSLAELAEHAARRGVRIGIESRRFPYEIPNLREAISLLAEHDSQVVGFWYDMGHCRVTANLGFDSEQDWLDALAGRIVGVHIHDVVALRDHLLPGMGEIDFIARSSYIPREAVVTWEVDWYFDEKEIALYRQAWQ